MFVTSMIPAVGTSGRTLIRSFASFLGAAFVPRLPEPDAHDAGGIPDPSPSAQFENTEGLTPIDAPAAADAADITRQPSTIVEAVAYIQESQSQGDLRAALVRGRTVMELFPDFTYGYAAAAMLLLAIDEGDEAERVIGGALERRLSTPDLALAGVEIAISRRDWSVAAERFSQMKTSWAGTGSIPARAPVLETRIANGLRAGRRADRTAAARQAEQRHAWGDALGLWQTPGDDATSDRDDLLGAARCLEKLGDPAGTDTVLATAIERYPNDMEILATSALVAGRRNDWTLAAARWHEFRSRFPQCLIFDVEAAMAFSRASLHAEADAILVGALERAPGSPDLICRRAVAAQLADNWEAAIRHWDEVTELCPDNVVYRDLRGEAIIHLDLDTQLAEPRRDVAPPGIRMSTELGRMLESFEALTDNCEFGLMQRHFGIDPASLLRFASIHNERLVKLLHERFVPLGDPEHMIVEECNGEYMISDTRGYYCMHTAARPGNCNVDKILRQQKARIELLKKKLVRQLDEGGRIYVCKNSARPITDGLLVKIEQQLARYGKNFLLGARRATAEHPPGSIEIIAPRIVVGYVETMLHGGKGKIDMIAWETIIRRTYEHFRADRLEFA